MAHWIMLTCVLMLATKTGQTVGPAAEPAGQTAAGARSPARLAPHCAASAMHAGDLGFQVSFENDLEDSELPPLQQQTDPSVAAAVTAAQAEYGQPDSQRYRGATQQCLRWI